MSEIAQAPARPWSRANARKPQALPEELHSPEGQRLTEAVLELERRTKRLQELTAHLPPPPKAEEHEITLKITHDGQTRTVMEWAGIYAVTPEAIRKRIRRGYRVDGTRPEATEVVKPRSVEEVAAAWVKPEEPAEAAEQTDVPASDDAKMEALGAAVATVHRWHMGTSDVGVRLEAEPVKPVLEELLDLAGVEGARVVARNARGTLIWVPAT